MREVIIEKSKNIGALCGFLKSEKNSEYLNFVLSNIPHGIGDISLAEKLRYFIHDIKEPQLCQCGDHLSFIGFNDGWRKTCGNKKCFVKIRKKSCLEKFGVDNPLKCEEIKERVKRTNIQKFGESSPMKSELIKDKFKKTMLERWGVEWSQMSEELKSKSLETWKNNPEREKVISKRRSKLKDKTDKEKLEIQEKKNNTILQKWGAHYMNSEIVKEKLKNTFLNNWGHDSPFKNNEVAKRRIESYKIRTKNIISSMLPSEYQYISHGYNSGRTGIEVEILHIKCGSQFTISNPMFKTRISKNYEICIHCSPISHGKSEMEEQICNFISQNYEGEIVKNYRGLTKEIDIFLPDLKLGFEFNGLYWHSEIYKDKNFHLQKSMEYLAKGISIIHIWEDEWVKKEEIVKSIILNKIGKSKIIGARSCQIVEIEDNRQVREFLEKNHIQGFVGSKIRIGLVYEGELVSLMTFGKLRRSLGHKTSDNIELLRFCNKIGYKISGGASKIFKYFLNKYKYEKVISYCDISKYSGELYKKLGFTKVSDSNPNYYWIIDGVRKHRFGFRKDVLIREGFDPNKTESEIMNEQGYYRIWDCGSSKWEFVPR